MQAKIVMSFFKEENVIVMDLPTQSPELGHIENVLKILEERSKSRNPETTE